MAKNKKTTEPINEEFEDVAMVTADNEKKNQGPGKGNKEFADPSLPVAQWRGQIDLGGAEIDCYVLPDGTRLLASTSAAMAISEVDRANLKDYAGQKTLNPFIDINKILNETRSFAIPGTQWPASGITTEHFELICRGYVQALYEKAPLTDRQREIAIRCAVLTAGLTRTGIDALVDEATGYQYERASDALAIKLRAFIAVELREWEKTFPDELWQEFGRLTNWKGPLHSRPRWWGKLVIELIYDTLDPDVADYLRANKPEPGIRWHRQLTENIGVRALVSRCYEVIGMAKGCDDMRELREKVAEHYGREIVQLSLALPKTKK